MEMQPSKDCRQVNLPHDRTIEIPRDPKADWRTGFWPGGSYKYTNRFMVSEEYKDKQLYFVFEGVYRDAHVLINDDYACHHSNGYTHFVVDATNYLRYGRHNLITVYTRSGEDSRWYTGTGIYRPVYMLCGNLLHIKPYGVKLTTLECDEKNAVIEAKVDLRSRRHIRSTVTVRTEIYDAEGDCVAVNECPVTVFGNDSSVCRQRIYMKTPELWDIEHTSLYQCHVKLIENGEMIDESKETFGIRKLSLDKKRGLRINGKEIKLRGGAIHHDNGVVGAAAYRSAEFRKIRLLKEAGFNAVRIAHNCAGRDLLDACDYYGLMVMNELSDVWGRGKTNHDYALHFENDWEGDAEALVDSSYNHPSVIMYSIGNEIPDVGSPIGSAWGRRIAEKIKQLDMSRFTINSINGLVGLAALQYEMPETAEENQQEATAGDINETMADMVLDSESLMKMEIVGSSTAESFACVDIAGYNYMLERYKMDSELFPDRIICGSETYSPDVDRYWTMVKQHNNIIGDFSWTAMDYLGEPGIGAVKYNGGPQDVYGKWPCQHSGAGDIDITGGRKPVSYYREIVYGLRQKPYIAVRRPEYFGVDFYRSPWAWTDCVSGWSWTGFEGKPIIVEVYADAEEVALQMNGTEIGRKPCTWKERFKAEFETVYEPGTLTAVAYRAGEEISRERLASASGSVRLSLNLEENLRQEQGMLYFVNINFCDASGILCHCHNEKVGLSITGPAELLGYTSAEADTEENMYDTSRTTKDGAALAVIKPNGTGSVTVTAVAESGLRDTFTFEIE